MSIFTLLKIIFFSRTEKSGHQKCWSGRSIISAVFESYFLEKTEIFGNSELEGPVFGHF
jgi:hypothetical protein